MFKYLVISLIFVAAIVALTLLIGPIVGDILNDLAAEWQ